jgi:hypothetical protein
LTRKRQENLPRSFLTPTTLFPFFTTPVTSVRKEYRAQSRKAGRTFDIETGLEDFRLRVVASVDDPSVCLRLAAGNIGRLLENAYSEIQVAQRPCHETAGDAGADDEYVELAFLIHGP